MVEPEKKDMKCTLTSLSETENLRFSTVSLTRDDSWRFLLLDELRPLEYLSPSLSKMFERRENFFALPLLYLFLEGLSLSLSSKRS